MCWACEGLRKSMYKLRSLPRSDIMIRGQQKNGGKPCSFPTRFSTLEAGTSRTAYFIGRLEQPILVPKVPTLHATAAMAYLSV